MNSFVSQIFQRVIFEIHWKWIKFVFRWISKDRAMNPRKIQNNHISSACIKWWRVGKQWPARLKMASTICIVNIINKYTLYNNCIALLIPWLLLDRENKYINSLLTDLFLSWYFGNTGRAWRLLYKLLLVSLCFPEPMDGSRNTSGYLRPVPWNRASGSTLELEKTPWGQKKRKKKKEKKRRKGRVAE